MSTQPIILNLHQPKSAGKSLEMPLRRKLGENLVRVSKVFPEISVEKISKYREEIANHYDEIFSDEIEVVTGHFYFGIHESINRKCKYISVIRNPVERLKSYYNYTMNSTEYFLKDFFVENAINFESLARFGDGFNISGYPDEFNYMVENGQVRLISGIERPLSEPVDDEIFQIACDNIRKHFLFLATSDNVNEVVIALFLELGHIPPLAIWPANVTKNKVVGEVSSELAEYISKRNAYDFKLLESAQESFSNFTRTDRKKITFWKNLSQILGRIYSTRLSISDDRG